MSQSLAVGSLVKQTQQYQRCLVAELPRFRWLKRAGVLAEWSI